MRDVFPILDRIIRQALEEDLGPGDVTTDAVVDAHISGVALLIAREELVLAGMPVFERVFHVLDKDVTCEAFYSDGATVPSETRVCLLKGRLVSILKGERTALNFLQRMSGIATLTRRYVEAVQPSQVKILDTRKTVPGLRVLDKYAVRAGGGSNHRFGLADGVLIKDNHIAAAGSISKAVALAKKNAPHTLKIEVEVEDLAGVKEACQAGADVILLDNMQPPQLTQAVQFIQGKAMIEASGGITLDTVCQVAATGVDMISVGELTHSPPAVDLSLEIKPRI